MEIKKAVIPAAGFGTRFLPATKAMPKEMLPIVDKPAIQYVVEELVRSGVEEIVIITGQNKRAIEDHFDYNFELEYRLKQKGENDLFQEIRKISDMARFVYIRQKEPLGNGHAVLCAKEVIGNSPFIVNWGDDIVLGKKKPFFTQLIEIFKKYGHSVLALLKVSKEETSRYGIIKPKKIANRLWQVLSITEKPEPEKAESNLASTGGFILVPKIFEILEKLSPGKGGEIWLQDAINILAKSEPVYGYEFEGERYDAGLPLGLLKANVLLALENPSYNGPFREFLKELKI